MNSLGYILLWDTKGCAAKRSVVETTYLAARLCTHVPKFPKLSLTRLIDQLICDGTLLKIGETDERGSYAIVQEFRDADLVRWDGVMKDAVTVFKAEKRVVVRNDSALEERIENLIKEHETYILGGEIGRLIHLTLLTNVKAVPIKQGVVYIPRDLPGTIIDMWDELAPGIQWIRLEQTNTWMNRSYLRQLCTRHLRKRLDTVEVKLIKNLANGRNANRKGLDTKKGIIDDIWNSAKYYDKVLEMDVSLQVEKQVERSNDMLQELTKEKVT